MVRVGDVIKITSENPTYDKYRKRPWRVESIATSVEEHPGYDEGVGGELVSCEEFPFSLYEWEFEEATLLNSIRDAKSCKKAKGLWDTREKRCWG